MIDLKTIQLSLKNLFYSLGGSADNVRNTDDVNTIIDEMAALGLGAKIDAGGGGLPEVTAEDNGDVLTVVEGEWAKAAPSGGGSGVLMVNNTGGVLDKTWQEIVDAPFAIITEDLVDGTAKLLEAGYDVYEGEYSVYFVSLFANELTTRIFSAASADAYPRENI